MNDPSFAHWMPIRGYWRDACFQIDWLRVGTTRPTDPFFEQTVSRVLRDPARLLFRRQTSIDFLATLVERQPAPNGFIFHLSRCGSTLVAQMLAALPQSIVLSEAPPLDHVISAHLRNPSVTRAQRIAWLRGMVAALSRPWFAEAQRVFIKFDSWHALELPLIREAFPDTPWIFLYRDPVEVLVSHRRQRGSQMIPGVLDPRLFGFDFAELASMDFDAYGARVLARIAEAALQAHATGEGRLVNFTELPGALWTDRDLFGIAWTPDDLVRMRHAATLNAKNPRVPHTDDCAAKQREASAELRELARTWLGAPHARLEAARTASASKRSRSQSFTTQSITR